MLMADTTVRPWTRAELLRLPDDGNRYEVLDGELFVTPLPEGPHQACSVRLASALLAYCDAHQIGVVLGPSAVVWGDNELQPDIAVLPCTSDLLHGREWREYPRPLLVVEIASPSTRRRDATRKRRAYLDLGIPTYWIVEPQRGQVAVIRPNAPDVLVTDVLEWRPDESLPPLQIRVAGFTLPPP
jgi:Uma2 family endonuclease